MSISVVIAEDDQAVMKRLVDAIPNSRFCEMVGVAKNRKEAVAAILANRADPYVVDLGLPDAGGVDLIGPATEKRPEACCVVVSTFGDYKHVRRSLKAGASGYLLKDEIHAGMVDMLVAAHNGQAPVSPAGAKVVIGHHAVLESNGRPQFDREKVLKAFVCARWGCATSRAI